MEGKDLVLFDGVCNLCNKSVQFIVRHDPGERFVFASIQSPFGQHMIRKFGLEKEDSIILIRGNKSFIRSTAVLEIARYLKGMKYLYGFIIVPAFLRNLIYRFISRVRYRWFGKREECMIPDPTLNRRFIN